MKQKTTFIILNILFALLISCGGGTSSSVSSSQDLTTTYTLTYDGTGLTLTIDSTGEYNLIINGSDHNITIKTNNTINNYSHGASNCIVTIEAGTTVNELIITGDDNTFNIPVGSGISLDDQGTNNQINFI